jgi:hypothetical protein
MAVGRIWDCHAAIRPDTGNQTRIYFIVNLGERYIGSDAIDKAGKVLFEVGFLAVLPDFDPRAVRGDVKRHRSGRFGSGSRLLFHPRLFGTLERLCLSPITFARRAVKPRTPPLEINGDHARRARR